MLVGATSKASAVVGSRAIEASSVSKVCTTTRVLSSCCVPRRRHGATADAARDPLALASGAASRTSAGASRAFTGASGTGCAGIDWPLVDSGAAVPCSAASRSPAGALAAGVSSSLFVEEAEFERGARRGPQVRERNARASDVHRAQTRKRWYIVFQAQREHQCVCPGVLTIGSQFSIYVENCVERFDVGQNASRPPVLEMEATAHLCAIESRTKACLDALLSLASHKDFSDSLSQELLAQ